MSRRSWVRAPAREYGSTVTNVNLQQTNYLTIKTLNLPAEICFAGSNPALAVGLSMQEVKAGFV